MPPHDIGLLSTLVISLVAAFVGGLAVRAIRLPPLIGYLLAGVLIGPFTPGIVADQNMANELAEVGVALLLFNIGMHFSFNDLLSVRKIAIPGALLQVALTTAIGSTVAWLLIGSNFITSLVIGLSLAIASTAVATRILEEKRQINALAGRVALGWLVVQDLIVIVALVLFPLLGSVEKLTASALAESLGKTFLQITGFVAVMVVGGRRVIPSLLSHVARSGSRELFTLAVIVIALGIAYGSALLFGVSLALGAFFAGVVIGESDMNHHAAAESLSMQQIFTILFFVSIGMLFDPLSVLAKPFEIIALLLTILFGTGLLTFLILLKMQVPLRPAALVGSAFAQIGEFSFVLGALGYKNGFYGAMERDLIIAAALLSIVINPLILSLTMRLALWATEKGLGAKQSDQLAESNMDSPEELWDHVILVGHGRVGAIVARALRAHGLRCIIVESDRTLTEKLRHEGEKVIYGDAAREAVLHAASPARAQLMIVTVPDSYCARQIIRQARKANPSIDIVVRTHTDEEARLVSRLGVGLAIMGERELAFGIADYALQKLGIETEKTRETIAAMKKVYYGRDSSHV